MTPFPSLQNDSGTCAHLHRVAQVLSAIQKSGVEQQPNALHLALNWERDGLTTQRLDHGRRIQMRFIDVAYVTYRASDGGQVRFALNEHTPQSLAEGLRTAIRFDGGDVPDALALPEDSTTPFAIEGNEASAWLEVYDWMYTALARFRARLSGTMTPIVVWAHGFDMAFLWFRGNTPDEALPHMAFGFSPTSAGFPRPRRRI